MNNAAARAARRDDNQPITHVMQLGRKVSHIVKIFSTWLKYAPTLMLVIEDHGGVFALDPQGERAQRLRQTRPDWIVGTYTRDSLSAQIREEVAERLREMLKGDDA